MSSELVKNANTTEERVEALKAIDIPMAAIDRFLESRELRVPKKTGSFFFKVSEQLEDAEFQDLVRQHKYAGRQTLNYFIITGISDYSFSEISEKVKERLPEQEEVQNAPNEPFLAESERIGSRLYLAIGYYESAGSEDPVTGKKRGVLITKRTVVVIDEESELVEIRGSDTNMVEKVRDEVCKSIGKYMDSAKERPNLGPEFQEQFNKLVGIYYNLKVRVDDNEDSTLDTISFTSTEDEEGNRRDARDSERVEKELSERGSEITMGYVELDEGFRFRMNREQSKLSFMKSEREENLNQVTNLVDNVLRKVGAYSQTKISGLEDVSE